MSIGRQEFQPKHGTAERWTTCRCRECVESGVKVGACQPWNDCERLEAVLNDIPGDAASWQALTDRMRAVFPNGKRLPIDTFKNADGFKGYGDGTVDHMTWGHARNIAEAISHLAFILGAAERGDDPDIPF